jgi:pyrroline-5-carboxylate reductase
MSVVRLFLKGGIFMRKIAFIGAGSMAEAIISGMITGGVVYPDEIHVINKSDEKKLAYIHTTYGVNVCNSVEDLLCGADIAVLAVKPKDVLAAMGAIKDCVTENMLFISVAAGVNIESLEGILAKKLAIVRAMPNTSAAVGKSATALAVNSHTRAEELELVKKLFSTIGTVTVVEESQLDGVTGLSGSGPAYIYYLVEAMEKSSEKIGLDAETAKQLIIQTLIGAAEMLNNTEKTPARLRQDVTSPGGTTEAGIKVLDAYGVREAMISCIEEAAKQSERMGIQLSREMAQTVALKWNA